MHLLGIVEAVVHYYRSTTWRVDGQFCYPESGDDVLRRLDGRVVGSTLQPDDAEVLLLLPHADRLLGVWQVCWTVDHRHVVLALPAQVRHRLGRQDVWQQLKPQLPEWRLADAPVICIRYTNCKHNFINSKTSCRGKTFNLRTLLYWYWAVLYYPYKIFVIPLIVDIQFEFNLLTIIYFVRTCSVECCFVAVEYNHFCGCRGHELRPVTPHTRNAARQHKGVVVRVCCDEVDDALDVVKWETPHVRLPAASSLHARSDSLRLVVADEGSQAVLREAVKQTT